MIFKEAEKTLFQYKLKWNLLRCVTIRGGRNICGVERLYSDSFTKLIKCQVFKDYGHSLYYS